MVLDIASVFVILHKKLNVFAYGKAEVSTNCVAKIP